MTARERAVATPASAPPAQAEPHRSVWAAFESGPYRLLWLNTLSFYLVAGIQRFAFVWLVLRLTDDSPVAAGLVTFALGIPVLFVALPAGVLSDRLDRRLLLIASQAAMMAVMAATALLIWTGAMSLPLAVLMAVLAGAATALAQPVRNAIVPSLVERSHLMNAIVMMTMGSNMAMIIGPVVGGATIALFGLGGVFALQAVIIGLGWLIILPLVVPPLPANGARRGIRADFSEGLRFVTGQREIGLLILLLIACGLLMMGPSGALIPQIAKEELGVGPFAASALFAFVGIGMFITSMLLASRGDMANKGGWFIASFVSGGLVFAGIGLSPVYALTAALMFAWGMGGGFFINLNQTLIQGNTPNELMGRVMSIHTLGFMGVTPMGALGAGAMANLIGAPQWVAISGGLLAIVGVLTLLTQPSLRRMS